MNKFELLEGHVINRYNLHKELDKFIDAANKV